MTADLAPPPRGPVGAWRGVVTHDVCTLLGGADDADLRDAVDHLVGNLDAALALDLPELLGDLLRWEASRLELLAPRLDVDQLLAALFEALGEHLDADDVRALGLQLTMARELLDEAPTPQHQDDEVDPEVRAYLDHVLAGRRDDAVRLVLDAVDQGRDVGELLLDLLQPAQLEVGRLWERGEITVAQEHLTTAITQTVMSMLYPFLFTGADNGRRLVATGVGSEAHEVGIRMVADLVQRDGWSTTYLGSGSPPEGVVAEVVRRDADVLAISATMTSHVPHVRELIAAVRADPRCDRVRVLVGGRPFRLAPQLVHQVGADGWAVDGRGAVDACNALLDTTRATA